MNGYKTQTTFASDLGWRPGHWPLVLTWQGVNFQRIGFDAVRAAVMYRNEPQRREVVVYND